MSDTPDCCKEPAYRRLLEIKQVQEPTGVVTTKKERCAVCGRNHYSMSVPPMRFGITGAEAA